MKRKSKVFVIIAFILIIPFLNYCKSYLYKELKISVPTAGNSWVINNISQNDQIITETGIVNWRDSSDRIRTFFHTDRTGPVIVAIRAKSNSAMSKIRVTLGNKTKKITLSNKNTDPLVLGAFEIEKPGYQWIEFQGIKKSGACYPDISDILIGGKAAEGEVHFIRDDFYFGRRGPSVHFSYEIPAVASDIVWFYNEITIPQGNDVQGSYYMANGFTDGYFGIQVNSDTERRILFSVWSPFKTDKPGDIPDEYKIILLKKGNDVITGEFGNEGSGGQSYRKFYWKADTTYGFLIKGEPSLNNSTDYTAYFFAPETGKWELIASFRRPKTTSYLKNLYSFLENFKTETGPVTRKGFYKNQWIRDINENWHELVNVKFTADATARKESRFDYSGGVENGAFYLKNCGFFNDKAEINQLFSRTAKGNPPQIDFSGLE